MLAPTTSDMYFLISTLHYTIFILLRHRFWGAKKHRYDNICISTYTHIDTNSAIVFWFPYSRSWRASIKTAVSRRAKTREHIDG